MRLVSSNGRNKPNGPLSQVHAKRADGKADRGGQKQGDAGEIRVWEADLPAPRHAPGKIRKEETSRNPNPAFFFFSLSPSLSQPVQSEPFPFPFPSPS